MKLLPHTTYNEVVSALVVKQNPHVLDMRGTIADRISSSMAIKEWQIVDNRVDVFSLEKRKIGEQATVAYDRIAHFMAGVEDYKEFTKRMFKLLDIVEDLKVIDDPIDVKRIGVMQRSYTEFTGTFDDLFARFNARFGTITNDALIAMGAQSQSIDIGMYINYKDDLGNFNTMTGPMRFEELGPYFRNYKDFPKVGFYFHCDYFLDNPAKMTKQEAKDFIEDACEREWIRNKRIATVVLQK